MTRQIILIDIGSSLTLRGVLPSVAQFGAYSARVYASGGLPPYTYTTDSPLPAGLSLDQGTGLLTASSVTQAGTFPITIRATDITGASVTRDYVIAVIAEPLTASGNAGNGTVGTAYSYTYTGNGGVPPYTWSISAGALPAGVTINDATGEISGTPTAGGAAAWTVRVEDTDGGAFELADSATVAYPDLVLTGDFDDATVGTPYSSDLTISGADGSYSNPRVTVGTLPTWATLSIVSGKLRLSGTPTGSATTVSITVAADSGDGQTATSAQSFAVAGGDPFWAQVISLLHCDGIDGSTVVTDSKGLFAWTVGENTSIDNSIMLIDGGAFVLGGIVGSSISYLGLPKTGWAFADSDFCLDITIRPISMPTSGRIGALFSNGDQAGPGFFGLRWFINPDGSVLAYLSTSGSAIDLTLTSAAAVISVGSRCRLRLSRSGPSFKMFAEGGVIASGTLSGALYRPTLTPSAYIGRARDRSGISIEQGILAARVDEWRMTIGAAREHDTYTPQTGPWPNA